ncbi:MAG: hypothetical protein ACREQ5_12040, partial [Candidatus Dormibacteria bacterium]
MAREAAEEAGYLPQGSSLPNLYDAMREDAAGRRVYPWGQTPEPGYDEAAQQDLAERHADRLRADLESLGEQNVADIPQDALHDGLEERLATIGADAVPTARAIIEREQAAADDRLHSIPEVSDAIASEDHQRDLAHEAATVRPAREGAEAPPGPAPSPGEGAPLHEGRLPENPAPGDRTPEAAEHGRPGAEPLDDDIPFSRREGEGTAPAGPRHDPEALHSYLAERLDRYGLGEVGLEFAHQLLDGKADGNYANKLITIALDRPGTETRTLDHEAIHALRGLGLFTKGEWQTLVRAARLAKDPKYGTVAKRVDALGYEPEAKDEEAAAIYHSLAREGKYAPGGLIGRGLRKINGFFEGLGNWLRGSGFQSGDDVLAALKGGDFTARPLVRTLGAEQQVSKRDEGRPDLGGKPPVPIVSIEPRFSEMPFRQARTAAQIWARGNIRGIYENGDTGRRIAVTGAGVKKATSDIRTHADIELLQAVPELLRHSVLVERMAPRQPHQGLKAVLRYIGAARLSDGRLARVSTLAHEQDNGDRFYDQHFAEMESPGVVSAAHAKGEAPAAALRPATGATVNIGDLTRGVKYEDGTPVSAGEEPRPAGPDAGSGTAPPDLNVRNERGNGENVALPPEKGNGEPSLSKREPGIDQTPEGEQRVIPGAERISDRELAERKMAGSLKAKAPQQGVEELGLFKGPD